MTKDKEQKDTIVDKIFSKQVIFFSSAVIIFIVFRIPIEGFISRNIVDGVLSSVQSIWYNDIIFIIIALGVLLFYFTRKKNYIPSIPISAALFIITTIYISYRFVGEVWEYRTFTFCDGIYYADILIFISLSQLVLLVRPSKKFKLEKDKAFYSDKPYSPVKVDSNEDKEGNEDKLGYTPYAKKLTDKLKHSFFKNSSFAVGINGKWGSGKTSFMEILKEELRDEDTIEVNFKPWSSTNPQAIIQDFFETLQNAIHPYNASLSKLFLDYSNKLVNIQSNFITQTIRTSASAINGSDSLSELYDKIGRALTSINRKIVVYIDDLDRLDNDEIMEVLRLIRNTANFPYTMFIVAYDKGYVVNAVKQRSEYKHEEFLEKIFQLEVSLPYFNRKILREELANRLIHFFKNNHSVLYTKFNWEQEINDAILGRYGHPPRYLEDWIETMRDVTRLSNTIILNSERLFGEIVFDDLLRIEILRIKFPIVYRLLIDKTEQFLVSPGKGTPGITYYTLKYAGDKSTLQTYLEAHSHECVVSKSSIPSIIDFVHYIFSPSRDGSVIPNKFSIVYPSKFKFYFTYGIPDSSLSYVEFIKARELSQDHFNERIKNWVEKGLEDELKKEFISIKAFDGREDFEKIISGIFYLANQKCHVRLNRYENLVGYDSQDLINKLYEVQTEFKEEYYPRDISNRSLREFVASLFDKDNPPYTFEADFLMKVKERSDGTFILSNSSIQIITKRYFKDYYQKKKKFNHIFWFLFHCTQEVQYVGPDKNRQLTVPTEILELTKKFIKSDVDGFLKNIVERDPIHPNVYGISNKPVLVYGDWKSFDEELKTYNGTSIIWDDFMKLFGEFKKNNFKGPVNLELDDDSPFAKR